MLWSYLSLSTKVDDSKPIQDLYNIRLFGYTIAYARQNSSSISLQFSKPRILKMSQTYDHHLQIRTHRT